MDMRIDKFNDLLTADKNDTQLLQAVRKLTTLENPEDVKEAAGDAASWDTLRFTFLGRHVRSTTRSGFCGVSSCTVKDATPQTALSSLPRNR
ncbi:MAG: hypothetical protein HY782_12215 [Chloroflexi bacterium]|nr:hypothetical protein [Chloroflexota bacterium]